MLPARRRTDDHPTQTTNDLFDPFSELDRVTSGMARLFDALSPAGSLASWPAGSLAAGAGALLADLEETDDEFVVEVELPGVARDDISVEVEGRRLVITAERKERERSGVLRRRTRHVGTMHHEVVLPADVEEDDITASLSDGVLAITLPKVEQARRKTITIS